MGHVSIPLQVADSSAQTGVDVPADAAALRIVHPADGLPKVRAPGGTETRE
jgi:hypothetical protein